MGTRKRSYNLLPVATSEWELHFSRSLADTSSRVFRDLTDFVCRIVERATIRPQRQRSPLHRSRSAVGRTTSRNRRGRSRTPSRGRIGRRSSPKRMILFGSSPLISPLRSSPSPARVVKEITPVTRAPRRKSTSRAKSPGPAAKRISPVKEKQPTRREKISPVKEKQPTTREKISPEKEKQPTRRERVSPEKQLNTRRFTAGTNTTTVTGSGAGPSAAQVKQKSTPRAIVRPSRDKTLRESIKAMRQGSWLRSSNSP